LPTRRPTARAAATLMFVGRCRYVEYMRTLTISRRIALGFALVVIIAACASVYSLNRLRIIEGKAARMQKESLPGFYLSTQIENFAKDAAFNTAHFVIVSNGTERAQLFTDVETNHQRT